MTMTDVPALVRAVRALRAQGRTVAVRTRGLEPVLIVDGQEVREREAAGLLESDSFEQHSSFGRRWRIDGLRRVERVQAGVEDGGSGLRHGLPGKSSIAREPAEHWLRYRYVEASFGHTEILTRGSGRGYGLPRRKLGKRCKT
jgi:hypothetical protein